MTTDPPVTLPDPSLDRLTQLGALSLQLRGLLIKIDEVHKSGPPAAADGSHVLGRLTVSAAGSGLGLTLGMVGISEVGVIPLDKSEARAVVMGLLNAGA